MDGSLQAIFNAAQTALRNDAMQTLYNGAQARQNAFAKINNTANQAHMLFSGAPKAQQMQYDAAQFIPNMTSGIIRGLQQQEKNQEAYNKHMGLVQKLNEQASKLEAAVPKNFK